MNKRKLMLVAVALCMVAILGFGGTLAYLTDTDSATNVMTIGAVEITQNEQNEDGSEFTQNQTLLPGEYSNPDGLGETDAPNAIYKKVSVTNNSELPVYIRTIFAFENTPGAAGDGRDGVAAKIWIDWTSCDRKEKIKWWNEVDTPDRGLDLVTIDGTQYSIGVYTYVEEVAAGATTHNSLIKFGLMPDADETWNAAVGTDGYQILVLSQAVQSQGWLDGTSADALDTAFGEVTPENVVAWFNGENPMEKPAQQ